MKGGQRAKRAETRAAKRASLTTATRGGASNAHANATPAGERGTGAQRKAGVGAKTPAPAKATQRAVVTRVKTAAAEAALRTAAAGAADAAKAAQQRATATAGAEPAAAPAPATGRGQVSGREGEAPGETTNAQGEDKGGEAQQEGGAEPHTQAGARDGKRSSMPPSFYDEEPDYDEPTPEDDDRTGVGGSGPELRRDEGEGDNRGGGDTGRITDTETGDGGDGTNPGPEEPQHHHDESGEEGEDDVDGEALVGRTVLRPFARNPTLKTLRWHLGRVTKATPPERRGEGWRFHVLYSQQHEGEEIDEEDLDLSELLIDLLAPATGTYTNLHSTDKWSLLKRVYEGCAEALATGTGNLHGSNEVTVRTVHHLRDSTVVTATLLRDKYRAWAKLLHPDKVVSQTSRVRYLAKWVLYAMRYLWETYAQQTDPSMVADKAPDEADYPAYGSKEFVTRAGAELESLTPTDAPRGWDEDEEQGAEDEEQGDEDGEDTEGRDGPVDEDPSVRLSDGGLPNSLECVNAFQLQDFGNSPFKTEMYVPTELMEKWATVFGRATKTLIDAVQSPEHGRGGRIGKAIRWYGGLPQLILRVASREGRERQVKAIEGRLDAYLGERFALLVGWWERESANADQRRKPWKPQTSDTRWDGCVDLFRAGYPSKGLQRGEGNGVGPNGPATEGQMKGKHPEGNYDFERMAKRPEGAAEQDLSMSEKIIRTTKAITGVGPRALRPGHIKVLVSGAFRDPDAKEAFARFQQLGRLYLDGTLPPWARRFLNSELLTPLVKEQPPLGQDPDCRPAKGRDMDVAVWTKAVQRAHVKELSRVVRPQQLAVAIPAGVAIKVIGSHLKLEAAVREKRPYVHVSADVENAHNEYDRCAAQQRLVELEEENPGVPAYRDLARAHHSDCSQPSDVYVRDAGAGRGLKWLCEGRAGGPQGSALTSVAFPVLLDVILKAVERKHPGVEVKAIQDDVDLYGDPADILGDDGALEFLLAELKRIAKLKPNRKKFQAYTPTPEAYNAALAPGQQWLKRPFVITDPETRDRVKAADDLARGMAAAARVAPPELRAAAEAEARSLATAASEMREGTPEGHRAYGIIGCGAAVGDDAFIADFLL